MANPRESELKIIRDIVGIGIPTDVRVARVASPLLSLRSAAIEAKKFIGQHHPDQLTCEDIVKLEDSRGNIIGGAIIWEASWEKETFEQGQEIMEALLREAFVGEQANHPGTFPMN